MNPYLATAAVLAAGLSGMEKNLKLNAKPIHGTNEGAEDIPRAPRTLIETTRIFRDSKLARDWWFDENYSHGLLVPFVIAFIVWREWDELKRAVSRSPAWCGGAIITLSMLLLTAGTLGAELFTQRISMLLMLAGVLVYFFGTKILRLLTVPFGLLLLSIPIPQIIFNRIAFPLQLWASQMAVWGIRVFNVPTVRLGNVIDILPRGSTQTLSLEAFQVRLTCVGVGAEAATPPGTVGATQSSVVTDTEADCAEWLPAPSKASTV